MIVYKVVRKVKNCYYSAIIRRKNGGLKYQINHTTYPEIDGSYLFAFKSLYFAKNFAYFNHCRTNDKLYILEANAEIAYPNIEEILTIKLVSKNTSKEMWRGKKFPYNQTYYPSVGTEFCSSITPIKLVDSSYTFLARKRAKK